MEIKKEWLSVGNGNFDEVLEEVASITDILNSYDIKKEKHQAILIGVFSSLDFVNGYKKIGDPATYLINNVKRTMKAKDRFDSVAKEFAEFARDSSVEYSFVYRDIRDALTKRGLSMDQFKEMLSALDEVLDKDYSDLREWLNKQGKQGKTVTPKHMFVMLIAEQLESVNFSRLKKAKLIANMMAVFGETLSSGSINQKLRDTEILDKK